MNMTCPVCGSPVENTTTCPYCGFKLTPGTASFNPIDLSATELPEPTNYTTPNASLTVLRGHQRGAVYSLGTEALTIGRDLRCDIFLNDMTVSRFHATITPQGATHKIVDNHSFNGLWVNNQNVEFKNLHDGDLVQIGVFTLVYHECLK